MMTITEVYCRINRARGLELVSPEDVLNACKLLDGPIKLRQYPSGAIILQLENHSDEQVAEDVKMLAFFLLMKDFSSLNVLEKFAAMNQLKVFDFILIYSWNKIEYFN